VPWNETRWSDDEFENLLHKAGSTLDLAARREIVGEMEKIMKERGSICLPFFMNVWQIYDKTLQGVAPSPTEFAIFHETWKRTGGNQGVFAGSAIPQKHPDSPCGRAVTRIKS
jgi:peptide/nickel transport system substrate-binding protein